MQQLALSLSATQAEIAEELLWALGACSVSLEDAGDEPLLEPLPGETPLWQDVVLYAHFEAEYDLNTIVTELCAHLPIETNAVAIKTIEDQDWVRACMADFKPLAFGKRLWIVPSWHQAPQAAAINITLDPGLAFGTGTHPTTGLCLGWLDAHVQNTDSVLDYGCGSGILAIAALKLGAKHAVGIDIDPQALLATRDNAERNHIPETDLQVGLPDALPADARFDLVIANILAKPLELLAPLLAAHSITGGKIILAGLLERQVDDLIDCYKPYFAMRLAASREGWALLEGSRKS